jgi:hypothetical protein
MLWLMTHSFLRSVVRILSLAAVAWSLTASLAAEVQAAEAAPKSQALRFDMEVDPLAYVARGYSLHLGLNWERFRFDLGAFGALVPEFFHGQKDFESHMDGYGAKLDVYLLDPQSGPFLGIEGGWLHQQIIDSRTNLVGDVDSWAAGGRVGWLFDLPAHFYIKPWLGVGYRFGDNDVRVGARTFEQSSLLLFPTFHLGYRFE